MINTRQIVNILRQQGHKVEYKERIDGGIFIIEIDGKRFSKSEGNKVARVLANAPLSDRKASQLKYATRQHTAYKKAGYVPKYQRGPTKKVRQKPRADSELTPEELFKRQLRRTQDAWRKSKAKGIITAKKARYNVEKEGIEATIGKLRRMELYAKGYAYSENVEALIERIEALRNFSDGQDREYLDNILDLIYPRKEKFKENWIQSILQMAYDYENKYITAQDFYEGVKSVIK